MSVWTVDVDDAAGRAGPGVAGRFRVDVARSVAAGWFPEQDAPVGERVRFEDL